MLMREWISEKMRRRPRRGPNESESTGKSGQELPSNQPAPLRPTYPEAVAGAAGGSHATCRCRSRCRSVSGASMPEPIAVPFEPAAAEQKMVVETQPESLATPPPEQTAAKSPRGLCGADDRAAGVG